MISKVKPDFLIFRVVFARFWPVYSLNLHMIFTCYKLVDCKALQQISTQLYEYDQGCTTFSHFWTNFGQFLAFLASITACCCPNCMQSFRFTIVRQYTNFQPNQKQDKLCFLHFFRFGLILACFWLVWPNHMIVVVWSGNR